MVIFQAIQENHKVLTLTSLKFTGASAFGSLGAFGTLGAFGSLGAFGTFTFFATSDASVDRKRPTAANGTLLTAENIALLFDFQDPGSRSERVHLPPATQTLECFVKF